MKVIPILKKLKAAPLGGRFFWRVSPTPISNPVCIDTVPARGRAAHGRSQGQPLGA
jgi:hypothetical protein